jgi:hypothetical protein
VEQVDKADTDVRRGMQLEVLKRDLERAPKLEEIVKFYLEAGTSPKWVAHQYGVDLVRCERYVEALKKQKEMKRERQESACGNRETPEVGEVDYGS